MGESARVEEWLHLSENFIKRINQNENRIRRLIHRIFYFSIFDLFVNCFRENDFDELDDWEDTKKDMRYIFTHDMVNISN